MLCADDLRGFRNKKLQRETSAEQRAQVYLLPWLFCGLHPENSGLGNKDNLMIGREIHASHGVMEESGSAILNENIPNLHHPARINASLVLFG
jgi:hypothetical protein